MTVSTGIISTIAGTGASSYGGDNGPAVSAALYYPCGVVVDSSGQLTQLFVFINYFILFSRQRVHR